MPDYELETISAELAEIYKPDNLNKTQEEVIKDLIAANTRDELKKQIDLFDVNQAKKNAARIIKLEQLRGKVEDQMMDRFNKRPDQMSNRELLDFLTTISSQIDSSQKVVDSIETKDLAKQVALSSDSSTPTTQYNINLGTDINKDSKDNVVDAIKDILSLLQSAAVETPDVENLEEPEEVEIINEN